LHVLCQRNSAHTLIFCFFEIHFDIFIPSVSRSSKQSLSKFYHKNYLCVSNLFAPSPLYSHFITLITFADNYKFGSSLLFNFLYPIPPHPLSCGLGAEYSHQHSFLKLFTLCHSPDVKC
jgi:hypothetical protein